MPFKSKAQLRKFHVMEDSGEIPEGTSHRWAKHTKSISKLPEKAESSEKKAFVQRFCREFFSSIGMSKEAFAKTREYELLAQVVKQAAAVPEDLIPGSVDEALKGLAVMQAATVLPYTAGGIMGAGAGHLLSPSKAQVNQVKKMEVLQALDDAVKQMKTRIVTRAT